MGQYNIIVKVLGYLELSVARQVCKLWHRIVELEFQQSSKMQIDTSLCHSRTIVEEKHIESITKFNTLNSEVIVRWRKNNYFVPAPKALSYQNVLRWFPVVMAHRDIAIEDDSVQIEVKINQFIS